MQLAYLAQCARPDICTSIAFLQTHVIKPDEDNYKELAREVKYLHATKDMVLSLTMSDDGILTWWIDASYVGAQ